MRSYQQFVAEKFAPDIAALSDKTYKKLTADEKAAIARYATAGYLQINSSLRDGTHASYQGVVDNIKSSIAKSRLPKDALVYRGTRTTEMSRFTAAAIPKPGAVYVTNQFLSTSTSVKVAWEDFANRVMFIIKVPKGTRALPIHSKLGYLGGAEDELLFAPGSKFKVDRVEQTGKMPNRKNIKVIMTCISDGL